MTLSRRRFISISAACAALPGMAQAQTWRGIAFGAEISVTLQGSRDIATQALSDVQQLIAEVENQFSLYDPTSALVGLNTSGILQSPSADFLSLMQACDWAYTLTGGLFDPTVQPLWAALALGQDPQSSLDVIGWDRVRFGPDRITLGAGQALTFNGIAQGFATDKVADALAAYGFTDALVNIGEYRGIGGPWTLGIEDPVHGMLGTRQISNEAIATSSPAATSLGAHQGHILHRDARPLWSTVTVQAPSATTADSLSTALVLSDRGQIEQIKERAGLTRVTLIDFEGNLSSV